MFEILLLALLVLFFVLLIYVRPSVKPAKAGVIEGEIDLGDLSVLWTKYNIPVEGTGGIGGVCGEPEEAGKNEEKEYGDYEYGESGVNTDEVLEGLAGLVNVENGKGVCEVFSLKGTVYVHTSGLNRVIGRVKGELEKEVLKEQAKLTAASLRREGFSSGFAKYEWADSEGHTGKSIYMPVSSEVFVTKFGLVITDSSKIISMKLEKRTWNS